MPAPKQFRNDVEDCVTPRTTAAGNAELREARRKLVLLDQENEVPRRTAGLPVAGKPEARQFPRATFPLVRDLTADGIPVNVTCRCWASPVRRTTPGVRTRVSDRDLANNYHRRRPQRPLVKLTPIESETITQPHARPKTTYPE